MPQPEKAVYAAIAGNVAVAITKFIAAAITGSSAMLAEAFHSVADTADGGLLLYGRWRARLPPDREHPFGHGQELYFWTFVVAMVVFAVGAGFSVYEGVTRILRPQPLENPVWSYGVLGLSALFEAFSFYYAYRQFQAEAGDRSWWRTFRVSKDATTLSVMVESVTDLAGIGIAFVGIWLAHHFHRDQFDGAASILIGGLLAVLSLLLARESKSLLLGESLDPGELEELRAIVERCPGVKRAAYPLTMFFGPDSIFLAIDVEFDDIGAAGVTDAIDRIEAAIRQRNPKIQKIFIEAERIPAHGGGALERKAG